MCWGPDAPAWPVQAEGPSGSFSWAGRGEARTRRVIRPVTGLWLVEDAERGGVNRYERSCHQPMPFRGRSGHCLGIRYLSAVVLGRRRIRRLFGRLLGSVALGLLFAITLISCSGDLRDVVAFEFLHRGEELLADGGKRR